MNKAVATLIRSLLIALCFSFPPVVFGLDGDTLVLKQSSPSVGKVVAYLNPKAFRIEQGLIVTVARAPTWQAYFFNNNKKEFYTAPFKEALKSARILGSTAMSVTEGDQPWQKGGADSVAGLAVTKWSNAAGSQKGGSSTNVHKLQCWLCLDKSIPTQCAQFLAADYGIPFLGGIPIRFSYVGKSTAFLPVSLRSTTDGEKIEDHSWLETTQGKKMKVSDAIFSMPKGFKLTNNFTELYLSTPVTQNTDILKDLLKDPNALFQSR